VVPSPDNGEGVDLALSSPLHKKEGVEKIQEKPQIYSQKKKKKTTD
jgi:hypothetical protein